MSPPPPDYYHTIRDICDRHNILMIVDEVVTGFGRTGLNFGIEHWEGGRPRHHVHWKRTEQWLHTNCRHNHP